MRSTRLSLTALLGAAALLAACTPSTPGDSEGSSATASESAPEATPTPTPTADPSTLSIVSGGDILLHLSVNHFAQQASGGVLDYGPLFEQINPWIEGADLALCSMEVPIVPPGQEPSNYPAFGAPPEIATSLKDMGWDGCSLATNHSMDRGFDGVTSTLDTFDEAELGHHGTARTEEEAGQIQYYDLESGGRDVTIAHLSASTLTNGIPLPQGAEWSWNVVGDLGQRSVGDLIDDAAAAREAGADLVVVSMHWGTEYVSEPIEEQTEIADQLAESGQVDLVFGNHSHVPEPVTEIDGGPDGNGMWVVWSMGNMISGQTINNHGYAVTTGLITTATVDVPPEGPASVSNLEWTAVTQDDRSYYLYPLHALEEGYTDSGMTLNQSEIAARADATYPVMADSGEQRTDPPVSEGTLVDQYRK
ncbi:MAG: CapA family protein [Ancrocorticia sp.]|uniref:CapA family protein n=1 Tax=Ancrocorticia sp. TaxID=2593684 RepID=UPI003F916DC0